MFFNLIRYKHILKNSLIFIPLFFNKDFLNLGSILILFVYFLSFSLASFSIYIFNDLLDLEKDKINPYKKNRLIASGKINKVFALNISLIIIFVNFLLNIYISNLIFFFLLIIYYSINFFYSVLLKKIIFLDIIILSSFYVIRLLVGHYSIDIEVSSNILILVFLSAFIISLGKRYSEYDFSIYKNAISKNLLFNIKIGVSILLIIYYLFFISLNKTIDKFGYDFVITIAPLIFGLSMYFISIKKNIYKDPVDIFTRDYMVIISYLIYFLSCTFTIYIY
tara:strand:+ start:12858 stop:13694 length:837 start_codon:yes stop_codon:yes gene_type:complete